MKIQCKICSTLIHEAAGVLVTQKTLENIQKVVKFQVIFI
jgi:hypothetical protein